MAPNASRAASSATPGWCSRDRRGGAPPRRSFGLGPAAAQSAAAAPPSGAPAPSGSSQGFRCAKLHQGLAHGQAMLSEPPWRCRRRRAHGLMPIQPGRRGVGVDPSSSPACEGRTSISRLPAEACCRQRSISRNFSIGPARHAATDGGLPALSRCPPGSRWRAVGGRTSRRCFSRPPSLRTMLAAGVLITRKGAGA